MAIHVPLDNKSKTFLWTQFTQFVVKAYIFEEGCFSDMLFQSQYKYPVLHKGAFCGIGYLFLGRLGNWVFRLGFQYIFIIQTFKFKHEVHTVRFVYVNRSTMKIKKFIESKPEI